MSHVSHLRCVECGREYRPTEVRYTCPACGITGILDVLYDYDAAKKELNHMSLAANKERSHWRYLPLLPLTGRQFIQNLQVGWTPVYKANRVEAELGLKHLYIKDDGRNPTASFKDRASSLSVSKALESGAKAIACASTGNAASSCAGFAAAAGLPCYIFVPKFAPEGKIAQLLMFGAKVMVVDGDYEATFRLSQQAIEHWGWYNRNAAINPIPVEGKKTCGLEIAEQFQGNPPDYVFMSVGDGCSIAGTYKGLKEMHLLGLSQHVPKMIGVQAAGAQPLKLAWERNQPWRPTGADTFADSIAVGVPRNPTKALNAIRESGGRFVAVSDEEIASAMRLLPRLSGVFAEPAAAAAFAGLIQCVNSGIVRSTDRCLVVVTGNGLKDSASAIRVAGAPKLIPPDLDAVRAVVE
ncbi:MAG: threonine synthase [Deinococcus sp.]|nr:threonine synthase [Deinococcus sp.]